MTTPEQTPDQMATPVQQPDERVRSDTLLPADDDEQDGRFDVAEEVNADQQSDKARRVGQAPEGIEEILEGEDET